MCLKDPTPITDPEDQIGEGWKVFQSNGGPGQLTTPCQGRGHFLVPPGVWCHEAEWRSTYQSELNYKAGWHVFVLKAEAEQWKEELSQAFCDLFVLRRVKYRGAYLKGVHLGRAAPLATLVAEEIFILPEAADV